MPELDIAQEMQRLSHLIDKGVEALRHEATKYADAEHAYRKAKATAWVQCPRDKGMISAERAAWVDAATADERRARDLSDGLRQAALEALRSRRQQVSAWQSMMAAGRAEIEFERTRPHSGP